MNIGSAANQPVHDGMLTPEEVAQVLHAFPDADTSIIKRIIFFDGWITYEECGGLLIFQGIDDSIQAANYGKSVFSSDPDTFCPRDVSEAEADEEIISLKKYLETHNWPNY